MICPFVRMSKQFAHLSGSIACTQANVQKQITDLVAVTSATTQWMHEQQARSNEIDKILADLCADMAASVRLGVFCRDAKCQFRLAPATARSVLGV